CGDRVGGVFLAVAVDQVGAEPGAGRWVGAGEEVAGQVQQVCGGPQDRGVRGNFDEGGVGAGIVHGALAWQSGGAIGLRRDRRRSGRIGGAGDGGVGSREGGGGRPGGRGGRGGRVRVVVSDYFLRRLPAVVSSRNDSVPVSMMWALKVSRSTIALQSRASVKVRCHSENGALEAIAMARRSSRSVKIWNSSFAPTLSSSRYPNSSRQSRSARP